jgi:hypothetical protein
MEKGREKGERNTNHFGLSWSKQLEKLFLCAISYIYILLYLYFFIEKRKNILKKQPSSNSSCQVKLIETKINYFYYYNVVNQNLSLFSIVFYDFSLSSLKSRNKKINKMNFWAKIKILKISRLAMYFLRVLHHGSLSFNFVFLL